MDNISESQSRLVVGRHQGRFRRVITRAWERWRRIASLVADPTPRGRANMIWELMIEEARNAFDGVAGASVITANSRTVLRLREPGSEEMLFQFKKLDDRNRPSNYPTQTALRFDRQLPLPGFPVTRLTVGYQLNDLATEIRDIIVVCMGGRRTEWSISILEPTAEVVPLTTPASQPSRLRPKLPAEVIQLRPKTDDEL